MSEVEAGRVSCYSGPGYAGEPRGFEWQGQWRRVARVPARWRTPDGPAYHVEVELGERFELHYHEQADRWAIRKLDDHPAGAAEISRQGGPGQDA